MREAAAARRWAWWSLLALGLALTALLVTATPWSTWPGAGPPDPDIGRDFTPGEIARTAAFHDRLQPPAYLALAAGLAGSLLLGLTRLGSRLLSSIGARLRAWPAQVVAGVAAVSLVVQLVRLPFAAWSESVLRSYGLSAQSWSSWLLDAAKGWAVGTVFGAIALLVVVGLARRFGPWWYVPGAIAAAGLVFASSYVYPVVVEPLYTDFAPMDAGPLRTSLLDLARRDGVAVDEVLVADASQRTTTLNAYVSGFGATRRIVVYDTLLRRAPAAQVRLVVAHELGHAEERDVLVGSALAAVGTAAAVVALALLLRSRRLLRRAGARSAADPAVVALVLALSGVAALLASPLQNLVSRHVEARADVHALDLTADPATFIEMQRRLAITNLSYLDPPLISYLWFASHPTPPTRIEIAREWSRQHGIGPGG